MPAPKTTTRLTADDFLAWEKGNEIKHEYINGEVYAMVGAKENHVTVAGNLFSLLRNFVRGGQCRVYMSDMKVRVEAANAFFYPDIVVTCDERDRGNEYFKSHPVLIVEVLSESTSAYDRGRKFALYRQLPELREYVIIDPDIMSVDCFRRDPTDHWVLYPSGPGETVELTSVGFKTDIEALYEDVTLQDDESPEKDI